jgi:hypothetical protein
MDDQRRTGADDDADIDLDTQELVPPASQEPLGYGPGEWASSPAQSAQPSEHGRAEIADSGTEQAWGMPKPRSIRCALRLAVWSGKSR